MPDACQKDQSNLKKGLGRTRPCAMLSEVLGDGEACLGFEVSPVRMTQAWILGAVSITPSTGKTYKEKE